MFGTRKQKELYAELKDMVEKALQKMGKEIEDNTQYLETMIDVRVKYLGDVETRLTSLEKRWHLYQNFLWGIVHHIHIPHDEMDKICKQADADWRHIFRGEPVPEIHQFDDEALNFSQPAREKYEAPKAEPALEAEETLFSELEKKKRNKRLVAPHPGMKQLRSWALHYGMTQREFSWGMSRLGYPIRKSEGGRDKGSCWLYPYEAERIYVEIKDQR